MGERDPRAYASQSTEQLTALLRQPGLPPQERQAIEAVLTARFAEELLGPQGRPGAPPGSPSAAWSPPGSAPSAPPQPAQPQHQPPPPASPQHQPPPPPPGQPRQQPVGRPVWDPPPQSAPRSVPPSSPPPASAAQARSGKKPPWWAGLVAALAVGVGVAVVLFILGRLGGDSGGGGGGGNQPGYSTSCYTDFGVCYLPAAQPVGSGCFCTGPSGSDPGTVR